MKNIAVIIPSFAIEYSLEFLSGIYDYFVNEDARVFVVPTSFKYDNSSNFSYQYWTSLKLLESNQIEAIICPSGMFLTKMSKEELECELKRFKKPIVSVALELNLNNCYNIVQQVNCKEIYYQIVNHLKTVHGCREFAFISANSVNSAEALDRYESYIDALKRCNLDYHFDYEIDGKFVAEIAKEELAKKYKSKSDVKFDAVVAANDAMAIAAIEHFSNMGFNIPKDIKIVGFDDTISSRLVYPKLSTISQNVYGQGYKAADIVNEILEGNVVEKTELIDLNIMFRQSCGCVSKNIQDNIYFDEDGVEHRDVSKFATNIKYSDIILDKLNIITFMDVVKSANTLRQFYYDLPHIVNNANMDNIQVCFYKEPIYLDAEEEFSCPKEIELKMYYDKNSGSSNFLENEYFKIKDSVFVEKFMPEASGIYLLHPIFSGESNYGYLTCKIQNKNFSDYNVYLKILINSLSQTYEYTHQLLLAEELKSENSNLKDQSCTDELTKILNRRGFKERGQRAIDVAQEKSAPVVVFFCDMDGLKKINDTYGHEMGDKAIRVQAEVLTKAFRQDDIVGRLSGDEFGVIAVGMGIERVESVRQQIDALNAKFSKKHKLPFILSISIGGVDLQSSSNLKRLLSEADKKLYIEKQIKHANRV